MKRATKHRLEDIATHGTAVINDEYATDILGSDARQRAEIRRHRRNMETLRLLTCKCATLSGLTCAPCRYVREAVAPKRRARK